LNSDFEDPLAIGESFLSKLLACNFEMSHCCLDSLISFHSNPPQFLENWPCAIDPAYRQAGIVHGLWTLNNDR